MSSLVENVLTVDDTARLLLNACHRSGLLLGCHLPEASKATFKFKRDVEEEVKHNGLSSLELGMLGDEEYQGRLCLTQPDAQRLVQDGERMGNMTPDSSKSC